MGVALFYFILLTESHYVAWIPMLGLQACTAGTLPSAFIVLNQMVSMAL
jgi:hypothetical protein